MIKIHHLIGEITDYKAFPTIPIIVPSINSHRPPRYASFIVSDAGEHPSFDKGTVPVVLIELIRLCVIRIEDVGKTIFVVVKYADTERFASRVFDQGNPRNIGERPIPTIPE